MKTSRIAGLYRQSVQERIDALESAGWLTSSDAHALRSGRHVLRVAAADRVIENVIGVFGLPLGIAPNFVINGKEYVVPLAVEEPSIVAALSAAAAVSRRNGGIQAGFGGGLLTGQLHVSGFEDADDAQAAIEAATEALVRKADAIHPRLVARGGGVRDIAVRKIDVGRVTAGLVVEIGVDTRDAMGANLVNTICEALAADVEKLAGGRVALAILSNLADRSLVKARMTLPLTSLSPDPSEAARIRDGIVLADEIARNDPHRAATHNKGIMNAIDPIAIATGNDWRAIEAGAHAFAARDGQYRALTNWTVAPSGDLSGSICLPLKPATVGGTLAANPAAALCLRMTGVETAGELACLMAAAGLAQNFSALRALTTSGIQKGHMRLHARSVVAAAGVPPRHQGEIVRALIAGGEIKEWKARELYANLATPEPGGHSAAGKVILFGEHAAVYGRHALALPIGDAVTARATPADVSRIAIPAWHVDRLLDDSGKSGIDGAINLVRTRLGVARQPVNVSVDSHLPGGMGLGASAALAVATTRAIAAAFGISIDNDAVNDIAFACEQLAHGTPSGVDNAVACFGKAILFRSGDGAVMQTVDLPRVPPLVIACASRGASTATQVAGVRTRRDEQPADFDRIFDHIDRLALDGAAALRERDYETLGAQMNLCHGLLNAIGVSTPELESMVALARENGAVGAKLTGAGGGGSIVALCPGQEQAVERAFRRAGFSTISMHKAGDRHGE